MEEWLLFFLRGVNEVARQAADTARRIILLREKHRHAITENFGRTAANGHQVLERLYESPVISVKEVQNIIGTSYPAANDLVKRLVEARILSELTEQTRNRLFWYVDYLDLFSDESP